MRERWKKQMRLCAHGITLLFDEHTGASALYAEGTPVFRQNSAGPELRVQSAYMDGDALAVSLCRADGAKALCRYRICAAQHPYVQLQLCGSGGLDAPFFYPPATKQLPDDQLLFPYNEGVILSAKEPEAPIPETMLFHSCETSSMSFFAALRQGAFLLCAAVTNLDAGIETTAVDDGLLTPRLFWESEKGAWGYVRECRFYLGTGGITEVCKCYRGIMEEKGLLVPLREKVKAVPKIHALSGAADVWLWNDTAMQKLYECDASDEAPSPQQLARRVQIARDMHAAGMHRVLWSVFDHHTDPEAIASIKSLGFCTTFYDIYTDVIPAPLLDKLSAFRVNRCRARSPYWPDGVQQKADGTMQEAWPIKGRDGKFYAQNYLCDIAALQCAEQTIPPHTKENGFDGRFIDVIYGNSNECSHPAHPATRTVSMAHKNRLMQSLLEQRLLAGTEVGREDGVPFYHYNEGMLSPILYRSYDAGRRMTRLYRGEQVDACILRYMLNPRCRVPLWELVFHDCVISYWYWGDSTNCCPELIRLRDLFCRLYGLPPLYSFAAKDWEQLRPMILDSYQRTTPPAQRLAFCEMTEFQYLRPDRLIQKTVFSDGTTVVANFSSEPFRYRGVTIAPLDSYIGR